MSPQTGDAFVLLFGNDSDFIDYASYQLATIGLKALPVTQADLLEEGLAQVPALVLVHWDTLGEACFRACTRLKVYLEARRTPVAIICETLGGGVSFMTAFSSGADDLIEGAHNPRIFLARVTALLGRRTLTPSARSGARA